MEAFTQNLEEWRGIVRMKTEEDGADLVDERRAGQRIWKCGGRSKKVELEV